MKFLTLGFIIEATAAKYNLHNKVHIQVEDIMQLLKLTQEGYRAAITEKFPAWRVDTLEYMGEGWESVAYRVNNDYIFRFPKREYTGQCLELETRLLPELAPKVKVAIPNFEFVSTTPGAHFPYPFVGYKLIEGLSNEEWDDELFEAEWWRPPVIEFIHAMHSFPLERARELGAANMNPVAKSTGENVPEPSSWRQGLRDFYELIRHKAFGVLSATAKAGLSKGFEDFLGDERNFEYEPVLLHADLSEDHIVLDVKNQKVVGIIDFGDVAIGDPAYDVFQALLPGYKGNIGPNFENRRKFYHEILVPFYAIIYGQAYDDPALVEEGTAEIEAYFKPEA
jgi:aminoglycoside 2''-phosphotransferase